MHITERPVNTTLYLVVCPRGGGSRAYLVSGHHVGLNMGVLAAGCCDVPMQIGALTADAGPHQLDLAHQARCEYAAPVYKPLQAI